MQRFLEKSVLPFQYSYVHLNPYDHLCHYEKQIPYDILGKSTLLLDHQGAYM